MKLFLSSLLLAVTVSAIAQTSYVPPVNVLGKKGHQFGASADYFKSSTRIDHEGDEQDFENGEGFSRIQSEFFGHYGLTGNLQLGGGVRLRQNQYKIFNTTTLESETETTTGVESSFVNFTYAFEPLERYQWFLEGQFRFRSFANDESKGTSEGNLLLGDDGNEYSAGIGLVYSWAQNFLTGRVGYRSPGLDLSTEIYWQLEGALSWKHFALIAGAEGVRSLNNDPFTDDPANRPVFNTGSTALYNSMNRQWITPYVGMNIALGELWRLEFRGSQVVTGRSTDLGTGFGVSLIRRSDAQKQKSDRKFKDYDFEGSITKVSPKKEYVVIDKGVTQDVQKGMKIDFYEFDYVGGNILLASGVVVKSKADSSIVKITHLYNRKKQLKEGVSGPRIL